MKGALLKVFPQNRILALDGRYTAGYNVGVKKKERGEATGCKTERKRAKVMTFCKRFRALRLKGKLTQKQAGEIVLRHGNTVARWERGERTPDMLTQEGALARLNAYLK